MKNPRRPRRDRFLLLLALLAAARLAAALTPTEWPQRQGFSVAAPGLTRIALPAGTYDSGRPGLADLRLVDAKGQEVPYLLDSPPRAAEETRESRLLRPKSFSATPGETGTSLLIETGTTENLEAVELESPTAFFLKAAHVEVSADGQEWQSLGPAEPVFRQFGAEQLVLALNRKPAVFVRVTFDNLRSRPVAMTGARLLRAPHRPAPPPLAPLGAKVVRRDEFAGETVLTVALDGRHVPLASLGLDVSDPLFMRRVTVAVREVRGSISEEIIVATGTLYRVALEGAPARALLDVPVEFVPLTRELLVHIHNGDSPPLTVTGVRAGQHAVNLLFMAPDAGAYALLTGNAQAVAPRYDLAAFAGDLRAASAATAVVGDPEPMPDYHPRESLAEAPLPDVPLTGAPLDARAWRDRRDVLIARIGVQELELDPAALARSRPDFADLRLLRAGNQIPYLLERPSLARSLVLTPVAAPDSKRPAVSVWQLKLPHTGLPVSRLVLASGTPLFQRQMRIYEKVVAANGSDQEITLAAGAWSRTPEPGQPETRAFDLTERPHTRSLWIETDNGDNPAIALGAVQVIHPVVRLVFKVAETDGFTLACGNPEAGAPRYDLSLVAAKLLTASRSPAQLAASVAAEPAEGRFFAGANVRYLFWGVLALVVIALLAVVAKLLPKTPAK